MKNNFKILSIIFSFGFFISSCNEKSATNNLNSSVDSTKEKNAVAALINDYKMATEKLDTTGTAKLFSHNAQVIETGSREGNYLNYEQNHIGAEFKEFQSFAYNNYELEISIQYPMAIAIESYGYEIKTKEGVAVRKI